MTESLSHGLHSYCGPRHTAGRVKTLHPGVHGGILARRDLQEHTDALEQHGIGTIDLVVVNLYPFRATVTAQQAPTFDVAIENIDIGSSPASSSPPNPNPPLCLEPVSGQQYTVASQPGVGRDEAACTS